MNIRNITFDKVIIKSKSISGIVWHATVRLHPYDDNIMGDAVVVYGSASNNVQSPNESSCVSYSFIKWKLISFLPWCMEFKCLGAVGDQLESVDIKCIYSLPLMDKE